MSRKPQKLKYGMWMYFLLFTVLVLGCVWGFQMLFVESYYQNMKLNEMYSYGRTLRAAENEYSDAYYEESVKCKEVGMNVYVVDRYGENVSSTGGYKPDVDTLDLLRTIMSDYAKSSRDEVCKLKDTGIVLIIGFFLAWYVASKLSKPISEMSVTAKRWANGDESAVFEPASNYSEITELADALNYAKEGISKSGTLQRDLLANVSHDLRTPLTMIKAYAEMIKDISGDNKQKRDKHTGVIIEEADRLTMLVNDILNLSKLQSSVDELELKEINLSELTERVIDRFSDFVENRGYKIEDNVAPDLLTVADEKKIEQVIYNLLGNSINYTGEDKTVKVYLTAENDKILLEIIDSGKGISEEKLATIWERYYRFSETNTRPVKGTGLGLSIVKAILDSHGLKFGVRSKKDCGSNFYVEFDRVKNNE